MAFLLAACATGPVSSPRLASSRGVGLGTQRLVVEFVDRVTNAPLTVTGDVVATLRHRDGSPIDEFKGEFAWLVADERGALVFSVDIPEPATYQLTFAGEDTRFSGPLGFEALESRPVVEVGEAAPRSQTRTSDGHPLEEITSDPEPDPAFYETTVADAVRSGLAVLVFGSPAHCLSASCATVLELVKSVAGEFPGVDFVHIETVVDPRAEPGADTAHVDAVSEWGLVFEPAVFVVAEGVVIAYFESALTPEELRQALVIGGG